MKDIPSYIGAMDGSVCIKDSLVNSDDDPSKEGTVLETFSHQVGGRSLILTYDRNTVCKPLNTQELRFYLDLPQSLRPFAPVYKGKKSSVVLISFRSYSLNFFLAFNRESKLKSC